LLLCRVARILLYEDCMNKPSCMMYPLRCFAVMFPGVEEKHTCTARPFFFLLLGCIEVISQNCSDTVHMGEGPWIHWPSTSQNKAEMYSKAKLYAIWNARLAERFFLIDIMYYHEKYSFLRNS
jgi:hypothetical protein